MKIYTIGYGEAFDQELGNTSFLFTGKNLPTVLFDCGYQVPERLWQLKIQDQKLDAVCLTHLHADHCFGLVPVLIRFWEENRTRKLTVFGPKGTRQHIQDLMDLGFPGLRRKLGFEIEWNEWSVNGETIEWRGLVFRTAKTVHTLVNHSIRVDIANQPHASFGISGDGQITRETRVLFADLGLLLQEIYTLRPRRYAVHADLKTVETYLNDSLIKKIAGSHYSRTECKKIVQRLEQLEENDRRWVTLKQNTVLTFRKPSTGWVRKKGNK